MVHHGKRTVQPNTCCLAGCLMLLKPLMWHLLLPLLPKDILRHLLIWPWQKEREAYML
jgi:hypothetical protein